MTAKPMIPEYERHTNYVASLIGHEIMINRACLGGRGRSYRGVIIGDATVGKVLVELDSGVRVIVRAVDISPRSMTDGRA